MKKVLLTIGSISAIALPIAAVVSCGSTEAAQEYAGKNTEYYSNKLNEYKTVIDKSIEDTFNKANEIKELDNFVLDFGDITKQQARNWYADKTLHYNNNEKFVVTFINMDKSVFTFGYAGDEEEMANMTKDPNLHWEYERYLPKVREIYK